MCLVLRDFCYLCVFLVEMKYIKRIALIENMPVSNCMLEKRTYFEMALP